MTDQPSEPASEGSEAEPSNGRPRSDAEDVAELAEPPRPEIEKVGLRPGTGPDESSLDASSSNGETEKGAIRRPQIQLESREL